MSVELIDIINDDCRDGLPLSPAAARGARGAKPMAPCEEEDAGRRVYQLLLLNAWRRRRTQVATLADSVGTLETQVCTPFPSSFLFRIINCESLLLNY